MVKKEVALQAIAEVSRTDAANLKPETELVADLGIDSAKALHLLVILEDRLETEIDDEELAEMKTVGDILDAIARLESAGG